MNLSEIVLSLLLLLVIRLKPGTGTDQAFPYFYIMICAPSRNSRDENKHDIFDHFESMACGRHKPMLMRQCCCCMSPGDVSMNVSFLVNAWCAILTLVSSSISPLPSLTFISRKLLQVLLCVTSQRNNAHNRLPLLKRGVPT